MAKASDIPGLKRLPKPGGFSTWYWSASQLTREAKDFTPRTARLWHGLGEPAAEQLTVIKARALRLTQDLQEWQLRARKKPGRGLAKRSPRGSIYFVRAAERVKIGFSKDVRRRVAELQTFFPEPLDLLLVLPGSILNEHAMHRRFADLCITREWFRYEERIARFVAKNKVRTSFSESHDLSESGEKRGVESCL
ncbi:GIY-YIG nuclease family protein [Bradyrhizobium sp. 4]|uniref:GIY-YIG nuclease family protein n=1 Tax=unclassified Bradyrhizobium TaxID=2631580 RepID=UPI001FF99E91|nr:MULTISPECIES: GIY-YIG nuclease family protein [unclassified Bradyrhizobium]MCK1402070.1 GIY-YIG nuclease family protein [Bradyrhizobium sp. 39]MCK1751210.1 GIY-YIG nuclease family protein [Bradyrhizobium sp. 135]UPJ38467.1 GIY-YIG nuclease family protein [Bradyrhizobium sp. 4]